MSTLDVLGLGAERTPARAPRGAAAPVEHDATRLPHVVAWNLTRRCNLACAHCYISAGSWHATADELDTDECLRIAREILAVNGAPMFILSGGEPLLRRDLETLAEQMSDGGATVVVGTNGTRLTRERIGSLQTAGVRGVAVSVDSLNPRYHDRFRHGDAALEDTLGAVDRLAEQQLDFVVQTTVTRGNRAEIPELAAWAAGRGAVSFNVYFLVATGRGEGMRGLTPEENDAVLRELLALEEAYRGRMLVRSKCQPQLMRHALERGDADSPLLNYATRCPCGVLYCRITPEGKVTPCPYMPVVAGDLRTQPFEEVWWGSPVLRELRDAELGGRCGRCEYRRVCGGCRARAYAGSDDYLAEDGSCSYEPSGATPVIEPPRDVTYGAAAERALRWTPEAEARLERIPSFVRGVVTSRVEKYAEEHGHHEITAELMAEIRRNLPVDFSKKRPFFLK